MLSPSMLAMPHTSVSSRYTTGAHIAIRHADCRAAPLRCCSSSLLGEGASAALGGTAFSRSSTWGRCCCCLGGRTCSSLRVGTLPRKAIRGKQRNEVVCMLTVEKEAEGGADATPSADCVVCARPPLPSLLFSSFQPCCLLLPNHINPQVSSSTACRRPPPRTVPRQSPSCRPSLARCMTPRSSPASRLSRSRRRLIGASGGLLDCEWRCTGCMRAQGGSRGYVVHRFYGQAKPEQQDIKALAKVLDIVSA